jgi:hypothetical protein
MCLVLVYTFQMGRDMLACEVCKLDTTGRKEEPVCNSSQKVLVKQLKELNGLYILFFLN